MRTRLLMLGLTALLLSACAGVLDICPDGLSDPPDAPAGGSR